MHFGPIRSHRISAHSLGLAHLPHLSALAVEGATAIGRMQPSRTHSPLPTKSPTSSNNLPTRCFESCFVTTFVASSEFSSAVLCALLEAGS